jgi:hypothetical protein
MLLRTEATLLTSFVSPYSNTTRPRETIIIPSVWCVFKKLRKVSSRSPEKPSDSGGTSFQSVPGQVHPFSSVNPSGGRSGAGATGVAGLALPKTLLWAGIFKGAATRLHTDNAAKMNLLLSIVEFYQCFPESTAASNG